MYFIKTFVSEVDIKKGLELGREVYNEHLTGQDAFEHFKHLHYTEKPIYLAKMGYDMDLTPHGTASLKSIYQMELLFKKKSYWQLNETDIVRALNLEIEENGGYKRFLDGLTYLKLFKKLPLPNDYEVVSRVNELCKKETELNYLACFKGEKIDTSDLFSPIEIMWVKRI